MLCYIGGPAGGARLRGRAWTQVVLGGDQGEPLV